MHCHQASCTLGFASLSLYVFFLAPRHASLFSYLRNEQRPDQTTSKDGKHEIRPIV